MAIIQDVIDESNPELVVYALATIHRANVNVNRDVLDQFRRDFDNLTLETTIPHTEYHEARPIILCSGDPPFLIRLV